MIHFDYWCDPAKTGQGWDHFLRAKESYAAFAANERAAQPDISTMALVAKGLKGEGRQAPIQYALAMTHWTGFHFLQGGHCWSHMSWQFNEGVAAALDRGECVRLTPISDSELRGWYRCTLCGLVVHDPECPSCSKSCPVCEVIESETAPADVYHVSSNDHLRFMRRREYGQPYDGTQEGPGDESDTDHVAELLRRARLHINITRAAFFLIRAGRGSLDESFRQISKDMVKYRLGRGATEDELQACALLHLEASTRCINKVHALTGVA